jgi:hypothetical protein
LVLLVGLTPSVTAQAPPPLPPGPPAAPAAAPPPASGGTLWQYLGLSKEQKLQCKYDLCNTPFGQLLNNSTRPLSLFSGGVIPPFCPTVPSPADLAKPGAEGVAAKIQADEAGAKARRAAVRYLATVDCRRWPEAEGALIAALRADRNECVRYEAALALSSGCCCTPATIEALAIVVAGSERDGNPAERSERVRSAALFALHNCVACYEALGPVPDTIPDGTGKQGIGMAEPSKREAEQASRLPVNPHLSAYYQRASRVALSEVMKGARRLLDEAEETMTVMAFPTGERSVYHVVRHAFTPNAPAAGSEGGSAVAAEAAPAAPTAVPHAAPAAPPVTPRSSPSAPSMVRPTPPAVPPVVQQVYPTAPLPQPPLASQPRWTGYEPVGTTIPNLPASYQPPAVVPAATPTSTPKTPRVWFNQKQPVGGTWYYGQPQQ